MLVLEATVLMQDDSNRQYTNFVLLNNEIQALTDQIQKAKKTVGFAALLRSGPKENTPLNGGIFIGQGAPARAHEWVKILDKTPTDTTTRLQLVASLFKSGKKHDLETLRHILIQTAIPVFLGEINANILRLYAQVYGLYLTKICNENKHRVMEIRSKALDNASLEQVNLPLSPIKRNQIDALEIDARVAAELLEQNTKWQFSLKSAVIQPYSDAQLNTLLSGSHAHLDIHSSHYLQITARAAAGLNLIKAMPLFYFRSLQTVAKMRKLDPRSPYAFLLEGRLNMQQSKYLEMRLRHGDRDCIPKLATAFNKTITSYRKGTMLVPSANVKKQDLPILSEFANAAYYGYVLRPVLKLSEEGVREILNQGMQAIEKAMLLDSRMATLQTHLMSALEGLSRAPGAARRAPLAKKKRRRR